MKSIVLAPHMALLGSGLRPLVLYKLPVFAPVPATPAGPHFIPLHALEEGVQMRDLMRQRYDNTILSSGDPGIFLD